MFFLRLVDFKVYKLNRIMTTLQKLSFIRYSHFCLYKFCTMVKIRILLVMPHYTAKNHIFVCKYPLASMQYTLLTWFLGLQFFFLTFHADYFTNWQHLHIWYCRHKRRIYVTTDCQNLIRLMTLNYKIVISFM